MNNTLDIWVSDLPKLNNACKFLYGNYTNICQNCANSFEHTVVKIDDNGILKEVDDTYCTKKPINCTDKDTYCSNFKPLMRDFEVTLVTVVRKTICAGSLREANYKAQVLFGDCEIKEIKEVDF